MSESNPTVFRFGEVCRVRSGYAFKSEDFTNKPSEGFAVIRMNNLEAGRLNLSQAVYVRKDKVKGLERYRLEARDFLFGMSGSLDNYALVRETDLPAYLNQRVGRLEVMQCDRDFARHLFLSETIRNGIKKLAAGNAQLNVSPKNIESIRIQLPPAEEQPAIARILDAVDTAIERTREAIEIAKQLEHSLLHDLLENGFRPKNDAGAKRNRIWPKKRVDEVAEVGSGVTLGKDVSGVKSIELPYLRVANVQDGHLDLCTVKTVRVPVREVEHYKLEPGDVLMTEGGDIDKLGRGTIWDGQIPICLHQNHIFRVRANRELLEPYFLALVVESDFGKRYFNRVAKRTTNLASTNKTQVRGFKFPIPPIAQQQRIAAIMKASKDHVSALTQTQTALLELKKSLTHDLLTGKLRINNLKLDKILNQ
jgi:type I restriction enzyme, S subunit